MATGTSAQTTETYLSGELTLPYWDVTIPVACLKRDRKERYVPFRVMCAVLGVERKRQLGIVKQRYREYLITLPVETATGLRPATWIRCPECAKWIGDIDPARCKITSRGPLTRFQADFREAAEKLLFEAPRKPEGKRGLIASNERHEYLFSCLYCGGTHRFISQNGEIIIEKYAM